MSCQHIPSHAIKCHVMPSNAMSCHQMPCHAIKCNAMFCHVFASHVYVKHAKLENKWHTKATLRWQPQLHQIMSFTFLPEAAMDLKTGTSVIRPWRPIDPKQIYISGFACRQGAIRFWPHSSPTSPPQDSLPSACFERSHPSQCSSRLSSRGSLRIQWPANQYWPWSC